MTDYHALIGKAVADLETNTEAARHALYESMRTKLVGQLLNMNPPLGMSGIISERLALEDAISQVEMEAALRTERLRPNGSGPAPRPSPSGSPEAAFHPAAADPLPRRTTPAAAPPPDRHSVQPARTEQKVARAPAPPGGGNRPGDRRPPAEGGSRDMVTETDSLEGKAAPRANREAHQTVPPDMPHLRPRAPAPPGGGNRPGDRSAPAEGGFRRLRDILTEAESVDRQAAPAARSGRQPHQAGPTGMRDFGPVDPPREGPMRRTREPPPREARPPRKPPPPPPRGPSKSALRQPQPAAGSHRPVRSIDNKVRSPKPTGRRRRVATFLIKLAVILGVGVTGYVLRDRIATVIKGMGGQAPQQREAASPATKAIVDQVQPQPLPAVPQHVVLYDEDPADPNGKRYDGSATWRVETSPPGPGQATELTVRCDIEIPERRFLMTLAVRRTADHGSPASHTMQIMFTLPADFPFGGIGNVPGVLMKEAEQAKGTPLAGFVAKVTSGAFLLGLAAEDVKSNIQLLKERTWLGIPVAYSNGLRGVITIQKGDPGERAFREAFASWNQ